MTVTASREVYEIRRPTEVMRHRRLSTTTRCGKYVEESWVEEVPDPPRPKHHVYIWTCADCYPKGMPQ